MTVNRDATTKAARFDTPEYNYAFLDEGSKREIRRSLLKAVAIPGYQVPFASRELPIGRGWGTGGLQITLSLIGSDDAVKVIDQGNDDSVNAVSIRNLIRNTSAVATTEDTRQATIVQSRHRIPEERLAGEQILVLQVPSPEPLREVEPSEQVTQRQHAEMDYSSMWLTLYESVVKWDFINKGNNYPVIVHERYMMAPSPIPRWDNGKLHRADHLTLFGAGREKKIYAIPPYTNVVSLQFDDYVFEPENFHGHACRLCGSTDSYMDMSVDEASGEVRYQCSDTSYCHKRSEERKRRIHGQNS